MNGEVTERRSQEPGLWSHVDRLSSAAHELGDFACLAQPQHSCRGMGVGTVVPATSGCWGAMCGERLRGFWTRKFSLQGSYSCESSRYLELVNYTICLPRACFLFTHGKWPSPCIREKSPAVHSISAVGGAASSVSPARGHVTPALRICVLSSQARPRERKKVFSAWMTDDLGLLFFGFQDTVLLLFPESFHLFFQCWKLMPVRSSETSWQHIHETIVFHSRFP